MHLWFSVQELFQPLNHTWNRYNESFILIWHVGVKRWYFSAQRRYTNVHLNSLFSGNNIATTATLRNFVSFNISLSKECPLKKAFVHKYSNLDFSIWLPMLGCEKKCKEKNHWQRSKNTHFYPFILTNCKIMYVISNFSNLFFGFFPVYNVMRIKCSYVVVKLFNNWVKLVIIIIFISDYVQLHICNIK